MLEPVYRYIKPFLPSEKWVSRPISSPVQSALLAIGGIALLLSLLTRSKMAILTTISCGVALQKDLIIKAYKKAQLYREYQENFESYAFLNRRYFEACEASDYFTLDELWSSQFGIDPNLKNHEGKSALMIAAENDDVYLAKRLLALPHTITSMKDRHGNTAFMLSLKNKSLEVAKVLCEEGVLYIPDIEGKFPEQIAFELHLNSMLEMLSRKKLAQNRAS